MKSRDNKGYWQRMAGLYGSVMKGNDPVYREVCDRIRPCLNRGMTVLELACGTGQLSYPLSPRVRLWEATDFSENMITEAKKRPHSARLHFSVQDATALPYADESFDAVVISNALHIMPDPEKALAESLRALKPDGLLFTPTIVWGEGGYSKLWKLGLRISGFKIYHTWSCDDLKQTITRQGFSIEDVHFLPNRKTPMCYVAARKGKGV